MTHPSDSGLKLLGTDTVHTLGLRYCTVFCIAESADLCCLVAGIDLAVMSGLVATFDSHSHSRNVDGIYLQQYGSCKRHS